MILRSGALIEISLYSLLSRAKIKFSIEGTMSEKDAGRVAVIMAWGKSISLVIGSITGGITAITALIKYIL